VALVVPAGVGELVEVGERAFAEFGDREMFLSLLGLTEVFQGTQSSDRGIEEYEKISNEDIIKKEITIAMSIGLAKLLNRSRSQGGIVELRGFDFSRRNR
jgi:hypothetical protein